MDEKNNIANFVIRCKLCRDAGRQSHTNLYINWEKRFYMMSCLNHECAVSEAFDENGNHIDAEETKGLEANKSNETPEDKN